MARGFSLLEVLIATAVMVAGVGALAQLFVLAIASNARARSATTSVILAQQKMEELTAESPPLSQSPPDALIRNEPGFYELVDGVFLRRWSVLSLPEDPDRAFVLQVVVTHAGQGPGVHLVSIATRWGP